MSPPPSTTYSPEDNPTKYYNAIADSYDATVGPCIRSVCAFAVSLLPSLPSKPHILDNACGTALLTTELLKKYPSARVDAVDLTPAMIEHVHTLVTHHHGWNNVFPAVMNAEELTFAEDTFDASFTMFGIFFFPDKGAKEIHRTLKRDGIAVVSTWRRVDWYGILKEARKIITMPREEESFAIPILDKWQTPGVLEDTLRKGGFEDVRTYEREALVEGKDLDDLVRLLVLAVTPQIGGWMEEEKGKLEGAMKTVLKEQKERFLVEGEGSRVGFRMVAWIAVVRK